MNSQVLLLGVRDVEISAAINHHDLMHYIFVDEAYSRTATRTKIAVASWAIEQSAWRRQVERLSELYRAPMLGSLSAMFDALDARASISTADLENSLFRSGEIDGTDDIPKMARTDNVWSQCAIYGVSGLIKDLVEAGQEIGTVDIYFDPKSLTGKHSEAIEAAFRTLVVPTVKSYDLARRSALLKKLTIRRIEFVTKPKIDQVPNKFHAGTWVADKICTNSEEIGRINPKRVTHYDITEPIKRTAQQFDGIPF